MMMLTVQYKQTRNSRWACLLFNSPSFRRKKPSTCLSSTEQKREYNDGGRKKMLETRSRFDLKSGVAGKMPNYESETELGAEQYRNRETAIGIMLLNVFISCPKPASLSQIVHPSDSFSESQHWYF